MFLHFSSLEKKQLYGILHFRSFLSPFLLFFLLLYYIVIIRMFHEFLDNKIVI